MKINRNNTVRALIALVLFFFGTSTSYSQTITGVNITQPTKTTIFLSLGDPATAFTASAVGAAAIAYEWYVDGELQIGQTSANFSFPTPVAEGVYSVYAAAVNAATRSNTARSIEITVIVNVIPPPFRWLSNRYVGTFHRNSETGERIIYAEYSVRDTWSVAIEDPTGQGSFIRIDDGSSDATLNSRLKTMYVNDTWVDPEPFKVTATNTTLSGNGNILFRVGMASQNNTGAPRYGRIVVTSTAAGSPHYIYVRQGEDADNISTETTPVNHAAVKWSPYNIGNYINAGNAGNIVDYPSKAGFFYQWSHGTTNPTTPWPYPPQGSTFSIPWVENTSATTASFTDVCPTGYRLPTGGDDQTGETESLHPTGTGTSNIWGYYADGFFDRRKIESAEGSTPGTNSVVSKGNDNVAYSGRLIYNPTTRASLFFPATGNRLNYNGSLNGAGTGGYYWSSTPSTTVVTNVFFMNHHIGGVSVAHNPKSFGYSVRCVYDPCTVITGVSLGASPSTGNVGTTTMLTASVTPSGATASYIWEVNTPAGWMELSTTNTNTYAAAIVNVGNNQFRVTATNSCTASPPSATTNVQGNPVDLVGGSAARITWEPASATYPSGRYIITYDPRDAGLYFKFGGVVGIYSDGGGKNKNLTPPVSGTAPFINANTDLPWSLPTVTVSSWADVPSVSPPEDINAAYHTVANVKAGKGDPCRLVGLNLADIANNPNPVVDNGIWRLPTYSENGTFTGTGWVTGYTLHWWSENQSGNISYGVAGGEFPKQNQGGMLKFLPAAGVRNSTDGGANYYGTQGSYWSSVMDPTPPSGAFAMHFQPANVWWSGASPQFAYPVRCVYAPAILSVNSTTWSPNATPQTSTSFTVTTDQGTWNAASDESWCTVSTSSGSTGGSFTITVAANDGAARTAHITITAGYATPVTVTVTQGACIPLTSISSLSISPSGTQNVGTSISITVTPTPSTATNLVYSWEYNLGSGWYPVLGSTGNVIAVPATPTPTQYRVTVSNGCSSFGPTAPVNITGSGAPTVDPGQLPAGDVLSYVGAFWRGTESGERVIRIDLGSNTGNYGPWMVYAVEYDGRWDASNNDGIMFAPGTSADPNIYLTSPGNAESYQLSSMPGGTYSAFVGGTASVSNPYIEFRIFPQKSFASTGKFQADHATNPALDANYTTTWPARYAVVYLNYGSSPGKVQKIYLRQGEGSDYVLYDEGSASPWVHPDGTIRPYARRFSPYNLTDPNSNSQTDYNNMTTPATGLLAIRGGIPVDYPTQGGYYSMYNYSRRAFNPYTSLIANYPSSSPNSTAWNPSTDETCPNGYKRPSNGANVAVTTVDYSQNEMTQSLLLDLIPSSTSLIPSNSTWGYYADGYFDRREIVFSGLPGSNRPYPTVVAMGTKDVAHAGLMFYSAKTKAHIFLPMAGDRAGYQGTTAPGELERFGYWGYYATTTIFTDFGSANWSRCFRLGSSLGLSGVYLYGNYSGTGMTIRCIRE